MQIEITARHVEVTEQIKDHARERIEKVAQEFPKIENIHVILDVEKYLQKAEIVVQAKGHLRLQAEESSTSMHASIDTAIDKIQQRLRRSMDKKQQHKSKMPLSAVADILESTGQDEQQRV